jgi:ketosteroid isomerase-like protein
MVVLRPARLFARLDLNAAFRDYSAASDARYMDNGAVCPSLAAYKRANEQFGTILEYVRTTPDSLSTIVLAHDAVMVTAPWHAEMKAKRRPEHKGRGVSSLLVQRREGRWQIVHTHESFVNPTEMLAALMPGRASGSD